MKTEHKGFFFKVEYHFYWSWTPFIIILVLSYLLSTNFQKELNYQFLLMHAVSSNCSDV